MRRRGQDLTGDLFAFGGAGGGGHAGRVTLPGAAEGSVQAVESVKLIASPLVDETAAWLAGKMPTLGTLLASDRAVEYVAILRAMVDFRRRHEPEPLHEDVAHAVCGDEVTASDESTFKNDLRQLKDWSIVTERIEKERLRGYRDNRRTKFRYRLCDEGAALVDWLAERKSRELNSEGDVTGNLLDLQCSLLHELRRKLRSVEGGGGHAGRVTLPNDGGRGATALPSYDLAGDVLYRVQQMRVYVEATARTLQELNLRLLSFGADSFSIEDAKPVVDELALFLDRFGRRFGTLRQEIAGDLAELRRECHAKRWEACGAVLKAEAEKFRHIASVKIPDAAMLLADAAAFYAPDGALVDLMHRIVDSARKVWGKLNARLRELERRNHRLEDLGVRLGELAQLGDDEVPYGWMQGLLRSAAMRGDTQIRPGGEKSIAPLPKASKKNVSRKTVTWITPRKEGDKANVASIAQVRAERLKAWMIERGIYPEGAVTKLSNLEVKEFEDFPKVVQLIEQLRLGGGEKARRFLEVVHRPLATPTTLGSRDISLTCEDLEIQENGERPNY